eukprot:902955-Amorphochlora_amoeboformis.AAC.1
MQIQNRGRNEHRRCVWMEMDLQCHDYGVDILGKEVRLEDEPLIIPLSIAFFRVHADANSLSHHEQQNKYSI